MLILPHPFIEIMQLISAMRIFILSMTFLCLFSCANKIEKTNEGTPDVKASSGGMMMANLNQDENAAEQIFRVFGKNNPGYELTFFSQTRNITALPIQRIAFMQTGGGTAKLSDQQTSKVSVGDIILLNPGVQMTLDSVVDLLVFTTPDAVPDSIPRFIRPDWDENITDIPGGCATETNAYRRILLTWLGKVGKYLYQSLNAHRVRIMDSFTHYHPKEGGFDEFYLVQMALPGAALITCDDYALLENHQDLTSDQIAGLLKKTPLNVGDLIYLPRGVVHRGIGGVLAQVITVPGFVPMAEIGVDHHLKKINQQFNLTGADTLPYNVAAGDVVMIK